MNNRLTRKYAPFKQLVFTSFKTRDGFSSLTPLLLSIL